MRKYRSKLRGVVVVAALVVAALVSAAPADAAFLTKTRANHAVKNYATNVGHQIEDAAFEEDLEIAFVAAYAGPCRRKTPTKFWCRWTVEFDTDVGSIECWDGAFATLRYGRVKVRDDLRESDCA